MEEFIGNLYNIKDNLFNFIQTQSGKKDLRTQK